MVSSLSVLVLFRYKQKERFRGLHAMRNSLTVIQMRGMNARIQVSSVVAIDLPPVSHEMTSNLKTDGVIIDHPDSLV